MKKFFYLFVLLFFVDFIMVITGFSSSIDNSISLFYSVHNNVTFTNTFKIIHIPLLGKSPVRIHTPHGPCSRHAGRLCAAVPPPHRKA